LKTDIKIFKTPDELAEKLAQEIVLRITDSAQKKKIITIALSGGSTPELLFSKLGNDYSTSVPWEYVHFFWGDERCVSPDNIESNFGMAKRLLFEKISIPKRNIHRIRGEADPEQEALRYSKVVSGFTGNRDGFPLLDLILLGMGDDGHTASIFPGNLDLLSSLNICEVAIHPLTDQKRITLTGKVINNADSIYFLVTGKKKALIVDEILKASESSLNYPASHIMPLYGSLIWFLDEEAANSFTRS
jgi:6-phosphogluconolactonase